MEAGEPSHNCQTLGTKSREAPSRPTPATIGHIQPTIGHIQPLEASVTPLPATFPLAQSGILSMASRGHVQILAGGNVIRLAVVEMSGMPRLSARTEMAVPQFYPHIEVAPCLLSVGLRGPWYFRCSPPNAAGRPSRRRARVGATPGSRHCRVGADPLWGEFRAAPPAYDHSCARPKHPGFPGLLTEYAHPLSRRASSPTYGSVQSTLLPPKSPPCCGL